MSTRYDLLEEFTNALFRDGLLNDDLSTRFEIWERIERLNRELQDINIIEAEIREVQGCMDKREAERVIAALHDLIDDIKDAIARKRH